LQCAPDLIWCKFPFLRLRPLEFPAKGALYPAIAFIAADIVATLAGTHSAKEAKESVKPRF
jgi:hypothetical protein